MVAIVIPADSFERRSLGPLTDPMSRKVLVNEISKLRFDALASYARNPAIVFLARELRWFEFDHERLLAALVLDTDGEYSAVFMARDLKERYRWVGQRRTWRS